MLNGYRQPYSLLKNRRNLHKYCQDVEKRFNTLKSYKNKLFFIRHNRLILKSQQRFKSEKHNVLTEEVNKIG